MPEIVSTDALLGDCFPLRNSEKPHNPIARNCSNSSSSGPLKDPCRPGGRGRKPPRDHDGIQEPPHAPRKLTGFGPRPSVDERGPDFPGRGGPRGNRTKSTGAITFPAAEEIPRGAWVLASPKIPGIVPPKSGGQHFGGNKSENAIRGRFLKTPHILPFFRAAGEAVAPAVVGTSRDPRHASSAPETRQSARRPTSPDLLWTRRRKARR